MAAPKKSTSVSNPVWLCQFCNMFFRKMLYVIVAGIVFSLTQSVFAAEVNLKSAEDVALNFITYLDENYTIRDTEPVAQSGQKVGYLMNLNPHGYILVAGDTIRVPVKAYSLTSDFDSLPPAYVQTLLNELQLPASSTVIKINICQKATGARCCTTGS